MGATIDEDFDDREGDAVTLTVCVANTVVVETEPFVVCGASPFANVVSTTEKHQIRRAFTYSLCLV